MILAIEKGSNIKEIGYETEELEYTLRRTYIPDFIINTTGGNKVYIEAKGYLRPEDRAKLLATRDSNPTADIRIVFMTDNKLSKKHKMRYSDWSNKYGFKYAFNTVPKEWFS